MYVATQLFLARGFARLRTDLGLAYTVAADSDRIGDVDSLYVLMCDAPEGGHGRALAAFCEVLEDLCTGDVSDEEVHRAFDRAMPVELLRPRPNGEGGVAQGRLRPVGPRTHDMGRPGETGCVAHRRSGPGRVRDRDGTGDPGGAVRHGARDRFGPVAYEPSHRRRFGTTYFRWDADPLDQVTLNGMGITREVGRAPTSAEFADVDALVFGQDGTITVVRSDAARVVVQPNQLLRGRELAEALRDRLSDRVIDLRGDAVAWFEMQVLLETHDRELIRSVWRELSSSRRHAACTNE